MSVCVFLGPSLRIEAARSILDGEYRPPAIHGDIYRATLAQPKPRAIGLIDGAFRHKAAVRHKEILWAMSEGIHVFGAASMGALRAAELADFGMIGIGQVFADFRGWRLEDDDEVAVDHGPAELGYLPTNDAMVDLRATFEAARAQCVIGAHVEWKLTELAKRQFYAERSFLSVIATARQSDLDPAELDRLAEWLPAGRVNRKRDDAVSLLQHLKAFIAANPPPCTIAYHFERTEMWEDDVRFATASR